MQTPDLPSRFVCISGRPEEPESMTLATGDTVLHAASGMFARSAHGDDLEVTCHRITSVAVEDWREVTEDSGFEYTTGKKVRRIQFRDGSWASVTCNLRGDILSIDGKGLTLRSTVATGALILRPYKRST